jgi:two-component system phosphate regulon response regulator PhoB
MSDLNTILCIEDNTDSSDLISFVFQKAGFEVTTCGIPQEGIRLARTNKFAAIILDLWLDGIDGIDICRVIRTFDAETPIIFYTGEGRPQKKQAALEAGAQVFLIKPEGFEHLEETVIRLINGSVKGEPQEIEESANLSFLSSKTYHSSSNN